MTEKKAWTTRGKMLEVDHLLIEGIADKNSIAARIFVTGEVREDYIGEAAVRMLTSINDTLYDNGANLPPLFIETKNETIRMTRFDPQYVWRCIHPDILTSLFIDELKRFNLNIDPRDLERFDFYESLIECIKEEKGDFIIPAKKKTGNLDWFYNSVYLSCLLLFGKPGYMDVHISEHFTDLTAEEHLKWAEYRSLTDKEIKEAVKLKEKYSAIDGLTNHELNFIVSLYEKD